MYIGLVGPRNVEMTKSANMILQSYYMLQRKSEYRDPSRTTVRMLDSLFRLSQAHCRLMFRTTILPVDAVTAVSLVDLSMQDCTLRDTVDALHSTFHKYPDFDYLCTAKKLLTKLNLYEIWQEELLYYGNLLQVDHKTLEAEINNNSCKLFAKYNDVLDDNIPLSSTLVTSSYFNNKNSINQSNNDLFLNDKISKILSNDSEDQKIVNNKLAATLHKHARLNIKEPTLPAKITNKRKRKEVTIDSINIKNKSSKKVKKPKGKTGIRFELSISDEELNDARDILNVVPSVNDVFNNLGIDFKFDNMCKDKEEIETKNKSEDDAVENVKYETKSSGSKNKLCGKSVSELNNHEKIETLIKEDDNYKEKENMQVHIRCKGLEDDSSSVITDKKSTQTKHNINKSEKIITNETIVSTINKNNQTEHKEKKEEPVNKLKQFQFIEKDLSKFYEENVVKNKIMLDSNHPVKIEKADVIHKKSSVSSSQISLFENSDCDIDFDI